MAMIGKRYAIIVGSNNYEKYPLDYTFNDVKSMAEILRSRCKFEIITPIELTEKIVNPKEEIDNTFKDIQKVLVKKRDTFLFYFSGHGSYNKTEKTSFIELSDSEKYSIKELYQIIENLGAKNSYLIIDACYSGGKVKSNPKTIRQHNFKSEGIYCLFAASKDTKAREGEKSIKNGIFTHFFLNCLNTKSRYTDGVMTIKGIEDYISIIVPKQTDFKQIPVSHSETLGTVEYFAFWDEKEEKQEITTVKPLNTPKEQENEIVIRDYEEGVQYNSKKQPIITIASSYFFHNRIREGFEQKTGLKIISDLQEAVARLEICLKDPIVFHNDYDNEKERKLYDIYDNSYKKVVTEPIWLFRNWAISIKKFEKLSPTKFLLYSNFSKYGTNRCFEIELSKLATFISGNRHQCFIYIEVKGEQPYQEGYAYKGVNGIEETQTLYDGKPLPTKEEDNFRIYRNGELIELSSAKKAERTHYIQKYNFLIGEQFSKWDNYSDDLDKILKEEMTLEEFVEKIKNKKPSDVEW